MLPRIITREEVAQKLRDWTAGRLSSEYIQSWAGSVYMSDEVDYADWESDENSVTNETVAVLDMLDMNLVLPEDAPIYLEFLGTASGEFCSGYAKMKAHLDAIDHDARKILLRDVPLYASFLQTAKK